MTEVKDNSKFIVTVVLSAVLVAGSLFYVGFNSLSADEVKTAVIDGLNQFVVEGPQAPDEVPQDSNEIPQDLGDHNSAFIGDENAPVTIVEFSEFQCPYCSRFIDEAYQEIKEKYVKTGKVKLVFRHFPLDFHAGAYPAALATECVREQGGSEAFFALHDMIFADNSILGGSDVDAINAGIAGYVENIGSVNMDEYTSCVESNKYEDKILADIVAGKNSGISGTPSFLVGSSLLIGAQPFSEFEKAIEAELAK